MFVFLLDSGAGNSVRQRETPVWQKKITNFIKTDVKPRKRKRKGSKSKSKSKKRAKQTVHDELYDKMYVLPCTSRQSNLYFSNDLYPGDQARVSGTQHFGTRHNQNKENVITNGTLCNGDHVDQRTISQKPVNEDILQTLKVLNTKPLEEIFTFIREVEVIGWGVRR